MAAHFQVGLRPWGIYLIPLLSDAEISVALGVSISLVSNVATKQSVSVSDDSHFETQETCLGPPRQ
jgi:hypothetical protein